MAARKRTGKSARTVARARRKARDAWYVEDPDGTLDELMRAVILDLHRRFAVEKQEITADWATVCIKLFRHVGVTCAGKPSPTLLALADELRARGVEMK